VDDNYARIVRDNLMRLYENPPEDLADSLPARREGNQYRFQAFGEECRMHRDGILLGGVPQNGALGILLSLYALHARPEPCRLEPLRTYKEFPDGTIYAGAFATHTEHALVPHVKQIEARVKIIADTLQGRGASKMVHGDFSLLLWPLPKIALCYIFYRADDEFPPSAACLFSHNASDFLPIDALADVGEYTSKKILSLLK
jgi:hypothetical protein